MCNDLNIVWLGFEKYSQNWPRNSQLWRFSINCFKNCRNDSNEIFYSYSNPYWSPLRNSVRFKRNFLQPFYTVLGTWVCNDIKTVWLGFEKHSLNWPRISQLWTFSIFSKTVATIQTKFSIAILHYMGDLCVQRQKNLLAGIWET